MEIMNQVSNLAFIIGAIYTWLYWKEHGQNNKFTLILITLVALVGLGSFIFHLYPSPKTIWIDLIPIQIFGLSYFAYISAKYFETSKIKTIMSINNKTFFQIYFYASWCSWGWNHPYTNSCIARSMQLIFII